MNTTLNTTKNTWYEDYLDKFEESFTEEEREYLQGWANYFDEYINNYEIIDKEADDLIDLLYAFKEDYKHTIQMPESIYYHELANDAKEIEEAQDGLEDLVKDTDNLYVGFEMEQLLVNWSPEEFANRVAEERPEFGDKLLNNPELSDYALQYIDLSITGNADNYSMSELRFKLQGCGLDADALLNIWPNNPRKAHYNPAYIIHLHKVTWTFRREVRGTYWWGQARLKQDKGLVQA